MTKLTKIFLVLSLIGFAAGVWIDASGKPVDPKWTGVLPLGAVFFGLFLIFLMLQKEMAAFDREEAAKSRLLQPVPIAPAPESARRDQQGLTQFKESRL
jgi:hypothetical protein